MQRSERKKTINQQRKWLIDKKILKKKDKTANSTVKRLYSFYQKNPLSTPIYLAYGHKKRISNLLEKKGKNYNLKQPQNKKISIEKYVKDKNKRINIQTKKQVSYGAVFKTGTYRKYLDRVQESLSYHYYIKCKRETLAKTLNYVERNVLPVIRRDLKIVIKNYLGFYKTPVISCVTGFKSSDFPQGAGQSFQRVAYTRIYMDKYNQYLTFFMDSLFDSIKNGFEICIVYEDMEIILYRIDIVITSDLRSTQLEKLRVTG